MVVRAMARRHEEYTEDIVICQVCSLLRAWKSKQAWKSKHFNSRGCLQEDNVDVMWKVPLLYLLEENVVAEIMGKMIHVPTSGKVVCLPILAG
jgi:hypothetical protein